MDEELTNYSFKKFCIVLEEIDDDDVRLILEHEKNGFSIRFDIKILEIKKIVLDLEILGNNISNNSLNEDEIIKQLRDIPINQKADAGYYSNILEFDGLNAELPTLDLAINDAFISIPFLNFNELKEFCDIFKQMVLNIFSQFNIDFNNVENVISITGQYGNLKISADDLSVGVLKFKNNIIAEFHLDYFQKPEFRSCKIIGTKGTIYWDSNSNIVKIYENEKNKWTEVLKWSKYERNLMFKQELMHFLGCIKKQKHTINPIEKDGVITLKIVLGIKKSARLGKMIKI